MNKFPKKSLSRCLLPILCIIPFAVTSCDKVRDPIYAGTWQFAETITTDGQVFNTIRTLILAKKSFEETYLVEREEAETVSAIFGKKGDLSSSHSSLIFNLKELGTCKEDELDACTGIVEWYHEGSGYWNDNIRYFEAVVVGEFEVDETTLRLKRDLNNDDDTDDPGEDVVFDRI
jgi:hypothetical protein